MKKFHKLKLFGMVAILTVALVFIGINLLDAQVEITTKGGKKPKPPKEEATWTVAIPGSQTSEGLDCNLYGLPETDADNTYQDEMDRVHVIVEKKKGGKEYLLRLFIYHSVYEGVCEELPYPHQIGFQNLDLVNVRHSQEGYYVVPEEFPCFFPNYQDYTGDCYPENLEDEDWWLGYDLNPRTGRVPGCMKHFLEEYPHPYCDTNCSIYSCGTSCPNCVYRYIDIRIAVDHNIEKMAPGETAHPTAQVWVEVVNNFDLQTGCEDWHNISGLLKRDNSEGYITITRSNTTNTWEITVDTKENPLFIFNEIYKGYWHERWEYKIPYWTHTPLKFITKWTRQPVE